MTTNFFQQEHISLQLLQDEKLQWVGSRGSRWRWNHLEVQQSSLPAGWPQASQGTQSGKPAPSPPTPVTAASVWAPRLLGKDTLQVVGALGGHRLRGVPGSRRAHAQRFFQNPQGRGGYPLLSSHLKRSGCLPLATAPHPKGNREDARVRTHTRNSRESLASFTPPTARAPGQEGLPGALNGGVLFASYVTGATSLPSYPEPSECSSWTGRDKMKQWTWFAHLFLPRWLGFLQFWP